MTRPEGANSSHDHGNCELCDYLEAQLQTLRGELIEAREEIQRLRGDHARQS